MVNPRVGATPFSRQPDYGSRPGDGTAGPLQSVGNPDQGSVAAGTIHNPSPIRWDTAPVSASNSAFVAAPWHQTDPAEKSNRRSRDPPGVSAAIPTPGRAHLTLH